MNKNNFRHLVGSCWAEHTHFIASVACGIAMGVLFSTRISTYQARMVQLPSSVQQEQHRLPPAPVPQVATEAATNDAEPELVFQPQIVVLSVQLPQSATKPLVRKGAQRTALSTTLRQQPSSRTYSAAPTASVGAEPSSSRPRQVALQPAIEEESTHASEASTSASASASSSAAATPQEIATPPAPEPTPAPQVPEPESFPAFVRTVHPVSRVPNWGAMSTPAEWKRTYSQMSEADWVPVPSYNMKTLTIPLKSLTSGPTVSPADVPIVTAKLYYSTRYMGKYDLDAGEHTGNHAGVDLKLPLGTPIGSIAGGRVYAVRNDARLGLYVVIEHRNESGQFFSIYGHLDSAKVSSGDSVKPGQTIGFIGLTGMTTLAHLHLEVHRGASATADGLHAAAFEGTTPINPMTFIALNGKGSK